ncbi:MAG: hypothetical protein KGD59_15120 [Candidatus Heimdallarchaeota archaeon]|nr:hypothetical protein [Candidatus Heimdallarchaeota archaeon]MBY8995879.1 hypothetical protein [Candidatus Heimdallarchaeota archaeon]
MKRSVIIVFILTTGLVIITSLGIVLYPKNTFSGNSNFYFQYSVNYNYCETENPERLTIQKIGKYITFDQVLWIYCNAYTGNFKLEISNDGPIIIIREIFDDTIVTRCTCPISIKGSINNVTSDFTSIQFILDNRYVDQLEIIKTFKI